jgi:hypothetical protein
MNPQVLAVTALIAVLCGGGLLLADSRARTQINWLRANGVEAAATVVGRAVQHRKPVVVCRLENGQRVTVVHRGELPLRMGDSVRLRHAVTQSGGTDAELLAEPRHSIGRGVGIALAAVTSASQRPSDRSLHRLPQNRSGQRSWKRCAHIIKQVFLDRCRRGVIEQVHALQRIVDDVVQLTLGSVMHGAR